jgi:hypothetical protein
LLGYTYGLDKIYARVEIEKAKISTSFEREYKDKDKYEVAIRFIT